MKSLVAFVVVLYTILLFSCSDAGSAENLKSQPLRDTFLIYTDASFYELLQEEAKIFNLHNKVYYAQLQLLPEKEAINALLKKEKIFIVCGRELSQDEENRIRDQEDGARTTPIAYDALAVIVNNSFKDSSWTHDQLQKWLSDGNKILVTDHVASSNTAYLTKVFSRDVVEKNIKAAGSEEQVLQYVKDNPEAIGFISVAFISDSEDATVKKWRSIIKILPFQRLDSTGNKELVYPFQSALLEQKYPFMRHLFIINLESTGTAGTAFASFVRSETGQKIVLKEGLLPDRMPGREIKFTNE